MTGKDHPIPEKGVVLDASALLASLYKEEGQEYVDALLNKTACFTSSVNWSEVVQKVRQKRSSSEKPGALLATACPGARPSQGLSPQNRASHH